MANNHSRPIVTAPTTPLERAMIRKGAQIASLHVNITVAEDKKNGIKDEDLMYADVLYGRGDFTNNHAGNIFFRNLVDEYHNEYVNAKKGMKTSVAKKVVFLIRNNGGRFLKKNEDKDLWFEVGDKNAITKTLSTFREGNKVSSSPNGTNNDS